MAGGIVSSVAQREQAADAGVRDGRPVIYVESNAFIHKQFTGVGRFIARLVERLAVQAEVRLFTFLTPPQILAMERPELPVWGQEIVVPDAFVEDIDRDLADRAHGLMALPHRNWNPAEAAQCPALYPLLRPNYRFFRQEIGILYDFTPAIMPRSHAPETVEHFGILFSSASALNDYCIAISRSTKFDARTMCALNNERIHVAYPGPSLCVHRHASTETVARSKNIILVVSTLEPRKNGPFLMDWFLNTQVLPPGMELWWVGPRGWWATDDYMQAIEKRLNEAGGRKVKLTGFVSDEQLCALYRQAAFTIYPSFYEGFGLPVLDSLLHETPVACSYNSSLQEFDCPGVHYFDPMDAATLDEAVREILENPQASIDTRALRQRFSWDKAAADVLRLAAVR